MARPTRTHSDPAVAGGDFDVRDVVRALGRLPSTVLGEVAAVVRRETAAVQADAVRRATWTGTTGRYRSAIRSKVFEEADGNVTGKVFVIQQPWHRDVRAVTPKKTRLWPKNLPLWLEYGTATSREKPHLIPAFDAGTRRISDAVRAILDRWARS